MSKLQMSSFSILLDANNPYRGNFLVCDHHVTGIGYDDDLLTFYFELVRLYEAKPNVPAKMKT